MVLFFCRLEEWELCEEENIVTKLSAGQSFDL
jgi:hypothetical protein